MAGTRHRNRPGVAEIAMPNRERDYTVGSGNVFATRRTYRAQAVAELL